MKAFKKSLIILLSIISFSQVCFAAGFKIGDSEWLLGGSFRLDTGYQFSDFGDVETGRADKNVEFFLKDPGDGYIFLKSIYGDVTAYGEMGFDINNRNITARQFYASYDIGGGSSLLIGHTYTILAEDSPNQKMWSDAALSGFGDLYASRNPQIRYTYTSNPITFKLAIEGNKTNEPENFGLEKKYIKQQVTPALAMALSFDNGIIAITPSIYAQQYKFKKDAENFQDIDLTTFASALDWAIKSELITLSGEVWLGRNLSIFFDPSYRPRSSTTFGAPTVDLLTGKDIKNIDSFGGWLQLAININSGKICTGAGYQESKTELPDLDDFFEEKISTWAAFINYEHQIIKNFTVTPEIVYFHIGKDAQKYRIIDKITETNNLGKEIFAGIHFQYDF